MRISAFLKTVLFSFVIIIASLRFDPAYAADTVNINTADAAVLSAELKGIGESRAKAIIAYREANGPFASPESLLAVKGIGEKILADNPGKITVK